MTSWWYTYWDNCNSKCRSVCPEVIFVHFPLSSGNPSSFFCFCFPWLPHFCLLSLSPSFLFSVPFPYFVLFLRFWNSFNFICFFLLLALPFRFYFFFFLHGHLHPPLFPLNILHCLSHSRPLHSLLRLSPVLSSPFLMSLMVCTIFVEFDLNPHTPITRLTINLEVSPCWPFAPTPCHHWHSYRLHVFLLHQICKFCWRERKRIRGSYWCGGRTQSRCTGSGKAWERREYQWMSEITEAAKELNQRREGRRRAWSGIYTSATCREILSGEVSTVSYCLAAGRKMEEALSQ